MAKFTKKPKKGVGNINTASLPDIVFMLLFFFMVVTTIKSEDPLVKIVVPKASEITSIEQKHLVHYINIGKPLRSDLGGSSVIQLNDAFGTTDDVRLWVDETKNGMEDYEKSKLIVALKVDKETKMGIVTSVKQELRKASAFKVLYSANARSRDAAIE